MRTILGTRANYVAQIDLAAKASRVPYRYYEDPTFYNKHEELLQLDGIYAKFFRMQAECYQA